mgnify:FL=1
MMKEQIVERYPMIESFHNGVNQELDEQIISINEATVAENCSIEDGNLSLFKGYVKFNEINLPIGDKKLMKFYKNNEATILIATNNAIYKLNDSGTAYEIISSGYDNNNFNFVNYQIDLDEVTVLTNGVDNVKVYDGTTFRDLKNDGRDSTDGINNKSPKGKFVELHKERLWISGDSEHPNRLYFSKDFDIDDWTYPVDDLEANQHGGFIDIPTWDGGIVIGMKSLFDDVVVFKNKNVFRIFGTYPGNYNVLQVFNTIEGKILNNTIASVENTAIWTSTEGIHIFNGVNTSLVSNKIKRYFDEINMNYIDKAVAVIHDRKYLLAVPTGSSTENNIIIEYDMKKNSFVIKRGINVTSFLSIGDDLLFTNSNGNIFKYGVGNTFDGNPIHSVWETGIIHFDEQNARKILNRIYFKASGTGRIKITCYSERKTVSKEIELTSDMTFYRHRMRNKGRHMKFRFENIGGCDFTIKQPQFMIDFDYD